MPALCESASGSSNRRRVKLWLDNHLPPALAPWMRATFSVECLPIRDLWVTCGNTSNARLRRLIETVWPMMLPMLERGETLVELGDDPSVTDPS